MIVQDETLSEILGNTVKMTRRNKTLPDDFSPDETLRERFVQQTPDGQLSCALAFRLAREFHVSEADIGHYADLCGVHLVQCQIGLFGYGPGKKRRVEKLDNPDPKFVKAVEEAVNGGVIGCADVFRIAEAFKAGKVDVGCVCETLGVKIKGCRFGAF